MHSQQPVGFSVGNHFDKPFRFSHAARAPGTRKRIGSDAIGNFTLLHLFFSQSDAGNLRPCVNNRRDGVVIDLARPAGDDLCGGDSLC